VHVTRTSNCITSATVRVSTDDTLPRRRNKYKTCQNNIKKHCHEEKFDLKEERRVLAAGKGSAMALEEPLRASWQEVASSILRGTVY
jgi:hypothetical protein